MRIALFGSSGHARVVTDVAVQLGHTVVGVIDTAAPDATRLPYLGSDAETESIVGRYGLDALFVAVGDNTTRLRIMLATRQRVPDVAFPNLIHPAAYVAAEVELGVGCVVMAGAVIQPGSVLGKGVIVNTSASIDHDCRLESFSSVAPGARLGGRVVLGERATISIGATVLHGRQIGTDTVVGAGAVVTRDLPNGVVAYGVPARAVRHRARDDPYL